MERGKLSGFCRMAVLAGVTGAALLGLGGCQSPQEKLRAEGLALYDKGEYPAASEKFDAALKYNEFDPTDNYCAGMAMFRQEKYDQAAYHFKLAWQADPSRPDVKQALTETLIRQGKPDLALDFLDRDAKLVAHVQDPRELKKRNNRRYLWEEEERMYTGKAEQRMRVAQVYEKLGDFDNAKVYFEQATQMDPRDPVILTALGSFYARVGSKAAATEAFRQAYKIDPKTPGLVDAMTKAGVAISEAVR